MRLKLERTLRSSHWRRRGRVRPLPTVRIAARGERSEAGIEVRASRSRLLLALIGGASALAGLGLLALARSAPPASLPVLVGRVAVPAGARLTRADVRVASLSASAPVLATLVPARSAATVAGELVTAPLIPGAPLLRGELSGVRPAAFTLTVGEEHALGGALRAGEWVSVLSTFQTANGGASTRLLATHLLVLAVGAPPSLGDPSAATIPVTVALPDPRLASVLALADTVGHIDLLRDGTPFELAHLPIASAPGVGT